MVVRIRLARGGQRNRAFYRIVAADARAPRDGRFIEILGAYDPLPPSSQEATRGIKRVLLNVERIKYWLSVGAQPSDPVTRLLGTAGILPFAPRGTRDPAVSRTHAPPVAAALGERRGLHTSACSITRGLSRVSSPTATFGLAAALHPRRRLLHSYARESAPMPAAVQLLTAVTLP